MGSFRLFWYHCFGEIGFVSQACGSVLLVGLAGLEVRLGIALPF